jgi:HK97 family phage major capsid protein
MKEKLQASLKSVIDEADNLIKDVGTREPTEAENARLAELSGKATGYKNQIDNLAKLEAAKAFGQESAGSYVAASFQREAMDGEGEIPGVSSDPKTGEMYAVDGQFKSIGQKKLDALKAGAYKDAFADYIRSEGLKRSMKGDAMKILSEGSDTSGGFWLPPDYRPDLIKKIAVMSTVRPNASVFTTGTDHITFPAVSYNGSSTDDTYANLFTSGVRFSWRGSLGSTSDITESTNPIAGQINIPVHLATAAIILTREQLEDNSFDLLGYISNLGAEAFALGEESAYTNGTGAGQPQGFLQHPANITSTGNVIAYSTYATRAGSTYWGNVIYSGSTTLTWGSATTGVIGTESQLPPQYETNAKWFGTKTTYAGIRAINAGTATLPQWSLGDAYPNYANGMNASLLGYSIVKNQFMPSSLATGYAYLSLADMSGYYIVDRVGLSVEVFREVYGLRDQVVVYMRKRTGGQLVHYWKTKVLTST